MSFASKVLYTGDGSTTDYTVSMPYISQSHIKVYVNEILQLTTMNYNWSGTSTIRFVDAPAIDAAIEIKRQTSPTAILVDFVDGSVLNANDLDTAYLHNYYLTQEYSDSFNEVINEALTTVATTLGVVEVDTDYVINQMVTQMIEQPAAANLQARIADIDLNAEAIITLGESLQVQINTLATGIAATIYIQPGEPVPGVGGIPDPIPEGARWYDSDDNNAPYIYQTSAWVSIQDPRIGQAAADITVLYVDTADNAAAIVTESLARTNADSAFASTLALLGAETDAGAAFLLNLNTVKVGATESLSSRFTSLQASIDSNTATGVTNASAITTEQSARVSGDSANASDITALDVRVTANEGDISTNVTAISGLQTQITTNAGNITASASDITQLQTDVDLRTTAFHQSLAPTANNVGDIWVDTDDGKLYIWSGVAWVHTPSALVTANAGAISTLQSTVSTNGTNIGINAADITTLDGQIATIQGDIVANSNAIDAVEINVSTNAGNITTNAAAITTLESDVDLRATVFEQSTPPTANNANDLWIDTDDNKLYVWSGVAWVPRQDAGISGNATAIGTLQTDVSANAGNIASNASSITSLNSSVGTLQGQMTTAQADITSNASSITTAEGDISSNASDISALTATVNLKTQTFVQAAPPTATSVGDIWYDSDDDNKIHRWNGTLWIDVTNPVIAANASAVSSLSASVSTNAGNITSNASSITSLQSSVTGLDGEMNTAQVDIIANAGSITTAEGDILTLEAKYGVTLDVNGYITGFAQNNDGTSGTFAVMADKFFVTVPTTTWLASTAYSVGDTIRPTTANSRVYECTTAGTSGGTEPTWTTTIGVTNNDNTVVWTCRDDSSLAPFIVTGNNIRMNTNVEIDGDLVVTGTINGSALINGTIGTTQIGTDAITSTNIGADQITTVHLDANSVTADQINVTDLNAVSINTGVLSVNDALTVGTTGHIKGGQTAYNTGTGFFLGYSSGYKFSIGNGSDQSLTWDGSTLEIKGDLLVGEYISSDTIILSATTERSDSGPTGGYQTYKTFTIDKPGTVKLTVDYRHGLFTGGAITGCNWQVTVNGVQDTTWGSTTTTTYATRTVTLTGLSAGDVIDIDMIGGERDPIEPLDVIAYMKNAYIKADVVISPGGSVDLD